MSYFFCYENYLNIFVVVLQHNFENFMYNFYKNIFYLSILLCILQDIKMLFGDSILRFPFSYKAPLLSRNISDWHYPPQK